MSNKASPTMAPEYVLYRTARETEDTVFTDPLQGLVCNDFDSLHVQVIPSALAVPKVEVMFWSAEASKFISANPKIEATATGAGVPFEFTVTPKGRRIFIAVTDGIASGDTVKISVAGYR